MLFFQLDVFADAAYLGNPLAVFPDASSLSTDQMQALAREMNLSETVFVTSRSGAEYEARIFTPAEELPFAGHPTIGCAWLLLELGHISGDRVTQHTAAGATPLTRDRDELWFERTGSVGDPDDIDTEVIAAVLGVPPSDLTTRWDENDLRPAVADAGVAQLMVPIRDLSTLQGLTSPPPFGDERFMGAFCFTREGNDIRARGFFQDVGIAEDPATGSAAAGLGLYLDRFVGPVAATITQGAEIGRRSTIRMRAEEGRVSIGGAARLVLKGELQALP